MKKIGLFLVVPLLFLLFSCAEQQAQQTTIEDLAEGLTVKLETLITSPTAVDDYVKVWASGSEAQAKKSEFTAQLRNTISTLGNKIEYLGIQLYETKASTPIYSFDLGMKPDDVDKVYLLHLMFKNQSNQQLSPYIIPFITLKTEADKDKIFLAVIFERNGIQIYPQPIAP
ncbi:hypothetical protein [Thermotoga profunda]|uniref:hypothetical protein n=1 Tax=Thermotoga profunda TaxID=1508420 RepID=UPI000597D0E4|nr:hypothetical protein [Thermotoga profunda]